MFAPGSKRTLTVLTFVTLGFTMLGVFAGLIPPSDQANVQASLLFALHGGRGYLMADKTSPTGYKLLITEADPHTIWFTDRPDRQSGTMLTAALASEWPSFFPADDEPNAVIMASGVDDPRQSVIEMGQPVYDPRMDALIANISFIGEDTELRPQGSEDVELGPVDLFIDDAVVPLATVGATSSTTTPDGSSPAVGNGDTGTTGNGGAGVTGNSGDGASGNGGNGGNAGAGGNGGNAGAGGNGGNAGAGGNGGNAGAGGNGGNAGVGGNGAGGNAGAGGNGGNAGAGGNGGNAGVGGNGAGGNGGSGSSGQRTIPKSGVTALLSTDPLDWTFHSVIPGFGETAGKRMSKTKLDTRDITDEMSNYIYTIPATALVSNFSDHHLDLISQGINLVGHTSIDNVIGN